MSKRNWAIDEESSDDGSIDDEEEGAQKEQDNNQSTKINPSLPKNSVASTASAHNKPVVEVDLVCYLSGIDPSVDRKTVGVYFERHGCRIDRLDLKTGDSRGAVAYIGFKDQPSMDNALRLNGNIFEGRKLHVRRMGDNAQPAARDKISAHPKDSRRGDDRKHSRSVHAPGREDENRGTYGSKGSKSDHMTTNRQRNGGGANASTQPEAPPTRPKLQLQQRTLPVAAIGEPTVANAAIFGGGKANDVHEFEVKKMPSNATVDDVKVVRTTKTADAPVTVFEKVDTAGTPASNAKSSDSGPSLSGATQGKRSQANKKGGLESVAGTGSSGGPKFSSYYNHQQSGDNAEAGSAEAGSADADDEAFAVVAKHGRRGAAGNNDNRSTSSKSGSKVDRDNSAAGRGSGGRGGHHHEKKHITTEKTNPSGRVVVEVSSAEKKSKLRGGNNTSLAEAGQPPSSTIGAASGQLFVATAQRANLVGGGRGGGKDGKSQQQRGASSSGQTGKLSSEKRVKQSSSGSASGSDAQKALGGDNLTALEKFDRAQRVHHQGSSSSSNVLNNGAPTIKQAPKNAFSALEGSDSD